MQSVLKTAIMGLVTISASLPSIASTAPPIEVGEKFPDVLLPSLEDGSAMRLSDFRLKPVVLQIFASW